MRPHDILMLDAAGLYCKPGGFHIDPVRPVDRAIVTHGHSDHARPGHGAVLATPETLDIMRLRYGDDFAGSAQAMSYGQEIRLGGVTIMFHPAGHVLGSAQIAVTYGGVRIVVSGDYKNVGDPTCTPFEIVPFTCAPTICSPAATMICASCHLKTGGGGSLISSRRLTIPVSSFRRRSPSLHGAISRRFAPIRPRRALTPTLSKASC